MIRSALFAVVLLAALGFFVYSSIRLIKSLSIGKSESRFDQVGRRLKNVLVVAFGQSKLLREPLAGLMHFFIFWGFVVLLSAVLEAIVEGLFPGFTVAALGPLFPPLALLQESIGILVALSCVVALVRWFVVPPRRYFGPEITGHVRLDATLILSLILAIIVSMFGTNATRMLLSGQVQHVRFASAALSGLFAGSGSVGVWFEVFWWVHILVVLGFLNYLPYSKHLHVLTSVPNVYFASLEPRGELSKLNLEDENAVKFGADDVTDLTWKQLLDGYTCTDCGRCTAACPANSTGKALSPRKIIMNIRQRTAEIAPIVLAGAQEQHQDTTGHRLLDNFVTEEELWACTTCRACMEECPVMIEHVPAIIDMRRFLVLSESRFPSELTNTFKNLETNFTPWAFSHETRADWAKGLDVKTMAEVGGKVDMLYWVGCAGSYDRRYEKVSRAMVKLLNSAGVRLRDPRHRGEVQRRSRTARRKRVPGADADHGKCRDAEPLQGRENRDHVPALFQHAQERVPAVRRPLPGRAPHGPAGGIGPFRKAEGEPRSPGKGNVPRFLLHRPLQRHLRRAPLAARAHRRPAGRDAAVARSRFLLRRRRGKDVHGRNRRETRQHRADRGGAAPRPADDRHGLPVLHDHDDGRGEGERRGGLGAGPGCGGGLGRRYRRLIVQPGAGVSGTATGRPSRMASTLSSTGPDRPAPGAVFSNPPR